MLLRPTSSVSSEIYQWTFLREQQNLLFCQLWITSLSFGRGNQIFHHHTWGLRRAPIFCQDLLCSTMERPHLLQDSCSSSLKTGNCSADLKQKWLQLALLVMVAAHMWLCSCSGKWPGLMRRTIVFLLKCRLKSKDLWGTVCPVWTNPKIFTHIYMGLCHGQGKHNEKTLETYDWVGLFSSFFSE